MGILVLGTVVCDPPTYWEDKNEDEVTHMCGEMFTELLKKMCLHKQGRIMNIRLGNYRKHRTARSVTGKDSDNSWTPVPSNDFSVLKV